MAYSDWMISMDIRLATEYDLADLFALNELFGNSNSMAKMNEALHGETGDIVCIARVDGVAAGFCAGFIVRSVCHGNARADIEALFVREEYRRMGAGQFCGAGAVWLAWL
jgi:hypothetical protein